MPPRRGFFSLRVGFPVWHLCRNLLARHLARGLADGLLVEALGLLVLEPCSPGHLARGTILGLQKGPEEVYRDGQYYGGVLLGGDLTHRLEKPQLEGRRALQALGGLPEAFGSLVLALCGDDLCAALALTLGLPSHGPLHLLRDLDVLDLHHANLHSPGIGLVVYDGLELVVYGLPVCQEVIKV